MKLSTCFPLLLCLIILPVLGASEPASEITTLLNNQVDAWNRGDIPSFVTTYADDCIFVGQQIARGREQLLARYRKSYPTREAMGHLSFSALDVHVLSADVAIVTGEWHLSRTAGLGNAGGLFSLVFQHKANGWKIELDHTS
jgi:uncharacterized protein (TIGR02246 family)